MDWLANDTFGVIDARTAEDETIFFCIRELVDAIQEAEVRLAWDKGLSFIQYLILKLFCKLIKRTGTRSDELLSQYIENAAGMDDQDIMFLVENMAIDKNDSAEMSESDFTVDQARQTLDDWIDAEEQGGRPKWFEIRMVVQNAMKYSCGIWNVGPAAVLTEMKEQFDDEGVMRY